MRNILIELKCVQKKTRFHQGVVGAEESLGVVEM